MSDPYLNCDRCDDQCACRATRDELNAFRNTLAGFLKDAERILGHADGEAEVLDFMVSLTEKIKALGLSGQS